MKYIIGIDAGTTKVKCVLFDETGKEIQIASRENHTIHLDGNRVEQDMMAVWEHVKSCIKEIVTARHTDSREISGIGITGQGEGCWLMDNKGQPVQNAILWCDGRAVAEVADLCEKRPHLGKLYHEITGKQPLLGAEMILFWWMKNHRREVLDQAATCFCCKDWIRYKMTGLAGTDVTDSGASVLNIRSRHVAERLLEALGLREYRSYFPDPVVSDSIVGTILDSFADEVGLCRGIPVIAGSIDVSASAVGVGAIHENEACVVLGTTCACEVVMKQNKCTFGEPDTRFEKYPLGDLYMALQPTLNGTPNLDWMLENIATTKDFAELDALIESVPAGCGGVIYHPYISVAGERAPFYHPYARSNFFGISQPTTRNHLIRAVYEGISFSIRDCLKGIDRSGVIFLAGGGAKSSVWAQMISDVMGMRVMVPVGEELGAKGVMLMAGVSLGIFSNYDDAVTKTCRFSHSFEPNFKNTQKYDLLYDLYVKIRRSNTELWTERHMINRKIRALGEERP